MNEAPNPARLREQPVPPLKQTGTGHAPFSGQRLWLAFALVTTLFWGIWGALIELPEKHPLPRFTVLTEEQKCRLREYFRDWGKLLLRVLLPGAHVCVAGHPILQHHVQGAMAEAGFEVRSAIMRLYYGFRGGDRPKNAEQEFPQVCVNPKGAYEPWMLFRKPIDTGTVAENLRRWKTGALRRLSLERPLPDVIPSGRTPKCEVAISSHPCLKPQHFMRIMTRALLPLGEGTILDPFMGSGSTVAAAEAVGYDSIGLEIDREYFRLAEESIPRLSRFYPQFKGEDLEAELNGQVEREDAAQLAFALAEGTVPFGFRGSAIANSER